jgi:hypothetical protein
MQDAEEGVKRPKRHEYAEGAVNKGAEQVLVDVAHSGPGDLDGQDHAAQAPADESDVRGLDRDVGARAEADVGLGKGGGIVDPVPDHPHPLALQLKLPDLVGLVLGQDFGQDPVDPDLTPEGVGRAPVITRQLCYLEAELLESGDGGDGVLIDRVGRGNNTGQHTVYDHEHGRLALVRQPESFGLQAAKSDSPLGQQSGVAQQDVPATNHPFNPAAGNCWEFDSLGDIGATGPGAFNDGRDQGMLRAALDTCGQPEHLVFREAFLGQKAGTKACLHRRRSGTSWAGPAKPLSWRKSAGPERAAEGRSGSAGSAAPAPCSPTAGGYHRAARQEPPSAAGAQRPQGPGNLAAGFGWDVAHGGGLALRTDPGRRLSLPPWMSGR